MYCPNCGKTNSAEQKFCRSCGFNLEKTTQSLAEQFPATEMDKSLQDKQRLVRRLLAILIGGSSSIFLIFVFWKIITDLIIDKGHVLGGLIFIAFIILCVLVILLALYSESLSKASSKHTFPQKTLQESVPTQKLLYESYLEPITSVTERTTELLKAKGKRSTKEV